MCAHRMRSPVSPELQSLDDRWGGFSGRRRHDFLQRTATSSLCSAPTPCSHQGDDHPVPCPHCPHPRPVGGGADLRDRGGPCARPVFRHLPADLDHRDRDGAGRLFPWQRAWRDRGGAASRRRLAQCPQCACRDGGAYGGVAHAARPAPFLGGSRHRRDDAQRDPRLLPGFGLCHAAIAPARQACDRGASGPGGILAGLRSGRWFGRGDLRGHPCRVRHAAMDRVHGDVCGLRGGCAAVPAFRARRPDGDTRNDHRGCGLCRLCGPRRNPGLPVRVGPVLPARRPAGSGGAPCLGRNHAGRRKHRAPIAGPKIRNQAGKTVC